MCLLDLIMESIGSVIAEVGDSNKADIAIRYGPSPEILLIQGKMANNGFGYYIDNNVNRVDPPRETSNYNLSEGVKYYKLINKSESWNKDNVTFDKLSTLFKG